MRFLTWAKERFPILNVTTAFVMAIAAKFSLQSDKLIQWSFQDLACGVLVLCHLFILRALDEHKDFESDKIYHPERILQKGLITLREIRIYGWIAFAIEMVCFLFSHPGPFAWGVFAFLWMWTLLMYKEFWIKHWLRPRLFIYSLSHLLVSPLIFLSVASLYLPPATEIPEQLWVLLTLSLATGFLYEIARKNKSAEEDQKGEISFSLLYGRRTTGILIGLAAASSLWAGAAFLPKPGWILSLYWVIGVLDFVLLISVLSKFVQEPTLKGRKKNEGVAGLISIWAMLFPIVSFILQSQHSWNHLP